MTKHVVPNTSDTATDQDSPADGRLNRRSFLAKGAMAGAATMLPVAGLMASAAPAFATGGRRATRRAEDGDVAILRFLAAAELIETDLWQQYSELANGNPAYMAALAAIDTDMPTYVRQNTEDERSHAQFINAILASEGNEMVNLDAFRTLPSSKATGAHQVGRLTNLMHLNVDTSWYTRYRSAANPDFGDMSPQIVQIGDRPSIPLHDGYSANQIQAIANTGAFHFGTIEQGGSSLYDAMSEKANSLKTLKIVTNIGGTEVAHFAIWNDKAGSAPAVDSGDGLVFPDLKANAHFTSSQVMPKPCRFFGPSLPLCSVIRPTSEHFSGAKAAVHSLAASGLFQGQSNAFFDAVTLLAEEDDEAMRGG